jgi:DnaJ-class molecular chaperone
MSSETKQCPDCKGKGRVVVDYATYECRTCGGTGEVKVDEKNQTNESAKIKLND